MQASYGISAPTSPLFTPAVGASKHRTGDFAALLENQLAAATDAPAPDPSFDSLGDGATTEPPATPVALGESGEGAGPSGDAAPPTGAVETPPGGSSPMPEIPTAGGMTIAALSATENPADVTILPAPIKALPDVVPPPKATPPGDANPNIKTPIGTLPGKTTPGITTPIGTLPGVTTPIGTVPGLTTPVGSVSDVKLHQSLLDAAKSFAGAGAPRIQFDISALLQLQGERDA